MTNITTNDTMMLLLGLLALLVPIVGMVMALTPYLMPKRECFAVTVPDGAADDPCLKALKRTYFGIMAGLTALAAAGCLAALFIDPQHAFVVVLVISLFAIFLIGYGLMLFFRKKVHSYKSEKGWKSPGESAVGFVGDEDFPRPLSLRWDLLYLPVLLVTVGIGIVGYGAMPEQIAMQIDFAGNVTRWAQKSPGVVAFPALFVVFMAGCFIFSHWSILRSKKGSDPSMPAASTWAYAMFARAQSMLVVVLGLAFSLVGPLMELVFIGALSLEQTILFLVVLVFVAMVGAIAVSVVYGQNGSRLIARVQSDSGMLRDDDAHWKLGVFYFNRDDAALFLPERFGIGWTINWGRPAAWAIVAALVLITAAFVMAAFVLI